LHITGGGSANASFLLAKDDTRWTACCACCARGAGLLFCCVLHVLCWSYVLNVVEQRVRGERIESLSRVWVRGQQHTEWSQGQRRGQTPSAAAYLACLAILPPGRADLALAQSSAAICKQAAIAAASTGLLTVGFAWHQLASLQGLKCQVPPAPAGCRGAQSAPAAAPPCRPSAAQTCGRPRLRRKEWRTHGGFDCWWVTDVRTSIFNGEHAQRAQMLLLHTHLLCKRLARARSMNCAPNQSHTKMRACVLDDQLAQHAYLAAFHQNIQQGTQQMDLDHKQNVPASSMVSLRSVRVAGLSVVSHSCSGIISPRPCGGK